MPVSQFVTTAGRGVDRWAPVLVFAGLPTIGLIAGPSYASMIIGLAVLQLAVGLLAGRGMPLIDASLGALACLFLLLCWASVTWSIVPRESVRAALGITGILVGLLVFCAGRRDKMDVAETMFRVLLMAIVVGVLVARLDVALSYQLESLISTKPGIDAATKYNRGITYLVLILWPVIAYLWWRRRWGAVAILCLAVVVMLAMTLSLAARVATATGLVVLLLAWAAPRLLATGLASAVTVYVAALPTALHLLAVRRAELAPLLKHSGVARLEIWDHVTARVFEHPIRGWGLRSTTDLPNQANEVINFPDIFAGGHGTYPHNQWLELWVELGLLGAILGLAFALLVLWRIRRLPVPLQKFAYAAFASAMIISSVGYEIVTDSWWCALAASGVLFSLLGRLMASEYKDEDHA